MRWYRATASLPLIWAVAAAGCADPDESSLRADASSDAGDDAEVSLDTGEGLPDVPGDDGLYVPTGPPPGPVPPQLEGRRWVTHYVEDIQPYWLMPEALGTPEGNFPTFRGMDGSVVGSERRRPRMISRQVFAYSVGYLLTGNARLLELARAGTDWLRQHAIDRTLGGCHPQLETDGRPVSGVRSAQDFSYCMMGLAAWFFVTRDPEVERDLLDARNLLLSSGGYWDSANGRIKDALSADMSAEVDVGADQGWELVAQLDPINAFMLLAQPVLSDAADRALWLDDMKRLARRMIEDFHADGIFWGVSNKKGHYLSRHADFGHNLKSYWMVLQLDKRLGNHPFHALLFADDRVHAQLMRALDADHGRWARRPTSDNAVEYGSDWWIYAEADQLAATLDLIDGRYADLLADTAGNWLSDYVSADDPAGEVIPSIARDGSPAWAWAPGDDAKCNDWKNGFHSSEHALVMAIYGNHRQGLETRLHFAVPAAMAERFVATPYVFQGQEVSRTQGETLTVGGDQLVEVRVGFTGIH